MAAFEEVLETPPAYTLKDVSASAFITEYAKHLKRSGFEVPKWAAYVKTGKSRELAPYDEDWFFTRAAALARQVYLHPGIGVGALAVKFGSPMRKRTRPQHLAPASRKVLRLCLKQLEDAGVLEVQVVDTNEDGDPISKGRKLTRAGRKTLDRIARTVYTATVGEDADDDEV